MKILYYTAVVILILMLGMVLYSQGVTFHVW